MKARPAIVNFSLACLVSCATLLTVLNVRQTFFTPVDSLTTPSDTIHDWRSYTTGGIRTSPASGQLLVITIFSDYECPFCKRLSPQIAKLQRRYGSRLAVIWRQYPAPAGHPFAMTAAAAAICAASENRFEQVHERLFNELTDSSSVALTSLALRAGITDSARFARCLRDANTKAPINRDINEGDRLGIRGTPTLLIDSLKFDGLPADLDKLVRYHMRVAESSSRRIASTAE